MGIFKAYDVRGIFPDEVNVELMYKIGRAFVTFVKPKKMMVGRDMRDSSVSLSDALIQGIIDQGCDVVDIGLCSTPMSYFGVNFLKVDGGIMVTASHNPAKYNGCKFMREEAIPISGATGIKDIEKLVLENKFSDPEKKGSVEKRDVRHDYANHIVSFVKDIKPLKVVIDAANGMGAQDALLAFEKLPCKVIPMYFELDGNFPNHEADPLKDKNVVDLIAEVKKQNANLGIAFDGDADRVFFITEEGEKVPADFITSLLAEIFLEENPGGKVIYDLRSSWVVEEVVKEYGGTAQMSRVGHSFMKALLRDIDGIFGGELSGHFYYKKNFYTDSAIITALKVLELMSKRNMKLSALVNPLKKYFQSGEINSKVEDPKDIMTQLETKYSSGRISKIDGIRIDFENYWLNVRESNTEPILRLNLEAKTKEVMEEKRDEVLKLIRS